MVWWCYICICFMLSNYAAKEPMHRNSQKCNTSLKRLGKYGHRNALILYEMLKAQEAISVNQLHSKTIYDTQCIFQENCAQNRRWRLLSFYHTLSILASLYQICIHNMQIVYRQTNHKISVRFILLYSLSFAFCTDTPSCSPLWMLNSVAKRMLCSIKSRTQFRMRYLSTWMQ